jgi:methylated-DNA-[protein]-cysteine S-methyltransferase
MEGICERAFSSALGQITVVCSDRGVREIRLGRRVDARGKGGFAKRRVAGNQDHNGKRKSARWAEQAARELQEYLAGQRRRFRVPLDLKGTPFQRRVWKALCDIPYGQTRSYGEIARRIGQPGAARAVGMGNHTNPVAIVVPCHRVIASDGSLGGYAGGLKRKLHLLSLEEEHRAGSESRSSLNAAE